MANAAGISYTCSLSQASNMIPSLWGWSVPFSYDIAAWIWVRQLWRSLTMGGTGRTSLDQKGG